jgi:hypothetical protein
MTTLRFSRKSGETILILMTPVSLNFDPSDPKINKGHLIVISNHPVKYDDFVMNTFPDGQRKS